MKKVLVGIVTMLMATSLVACGNNKAKEKETESTSEENAVTYASKEFVEGSITVATYPSREGWISEQETTDIKEVLETKELVATSDTGATVKVLESIYAGDSGLSKYHIEHTTAAGDVTNITFEGPSGISSKVVFDADVWFTIYGDSDNKKIGFVIADLKIVFGISDEEYVTVMENVAQKMGEEDLTQKEWLELFSLPDATYFTRTSEYVEMIYELYDGLSVGYSYLRWNFNNSKYIVCDYSQNMEGYDDSSAMLIYDSIQWE